jgi:hypothetical protein
MQLGLNLGFSPARRRSGHGGRIGGSQFWTFTENTTGKSINSIDLTITEKTLVDWGDKTANLYLTSPSNFNKTLGNSKGITLNPARSIQVLNVPSSTGGVGGNVDVSELTNLIELAINSSFIKSITGYNNLPNLQYLSFSGNLGSNITLPSRLELPQLIQFQCQYSNISGNFPFLNLPTCFDFWCYDNNLTGSLPRFSNIETSEGIGAINTFLCFNNQLTGSIPSLSGLAILENFQCQNNRLTGSIPNLSANTILKVFDCSNQQGTTKLTGAIPSLTGLTQLQQFKCNSNQLTGSIPALSGLATLQEFDCGRNNLTGVMPVTSGMTSLIYFSCYENNLTGTISSVNGRSNLTTLLLYNNQFTGQGGSAVPASLGTYRAENNLLTESEVNKILNFFVVAGKTTGTLVLNIGGTGNAAPTGQGLTDKATLISRGWTVTTN